MSKSNVALSQELGLEDLSIPSSTKIVTQVFFC